MISAFEALVLGFVQGLTEFIPVSSSGHLVLLHELFGSQAGGLSFDVALHLGTLLALLAVFYKDLINLFKDLFVKDSDNRLLKLLIIATIPAVVAGLLLETTAETVFRSPVIVSVALITVAVIMILAERYSETLEEKTKYASVGKGQALIIGLAQAIAIIPGVSRSGSTITAGIIAGLDRVAATKFSFMLAIPIIFGASLRVAFSGNNLEHVSSNLDVFMLGITSAFISGVIAIRFLLKFLAKHSLRVFAYYRIALGIAVLVLLV